MNSSSFQFSDASQPELLAVLRTVLSCEISVVIYPPAPSSWPSICWSCRSLLEYLSHPALSSTCCELQQIRWHCSGVIPSLMWPDCQLWAFNAEVTNFSKIVLPPCPHSYPPMLVLSFATTGRAALDGVPLFPFHDTGLPRTGRSSAMPPSNFGPSLVILGRFRPRPGPLV